MKSRKTSLSPPLVSSPYKSKSRIIFPTDSRHRRVRHSTNARRDERIEDKNHQTAEYVKYTEITKPIIPFPRIQCIPQAINTSLTAIITASPHFPSKCLTTNSNHRPLGGLEFLRIVATKTMLTVLQKFESIGNIMLPQLVRHHDGLLVWHIRITGSVNQRRQRVFSEATFRISS